MKYVQVPLERVLPEHFDQLRVRCTAAGLSPHSIEQTADDIGLLTGIEKGRKLDLPAPDPVVPTVKHVGAIYRHVHVAQWPVNRPWMTCSTTQWWQSWLVVVGWWGLRIRDIRSLTMTCYETGRLTASKTKKTHPLPKMPFLSRHVRQLNAKGSLFGTLPEKQLRRELARIAGAAGVDYVPPHGFRRFAITQWSQANEQAGKIIHGEGLSRVMRHYVQPGTILARWAPQVDIPRQWLTRKEIADSIRAENELVACYRRASKETRDALLRLARAV